jgi:threonine dehydrogenase-like Zn-dependent dehydrogenase
MRHLRRFEDEIGFSISPGFRAVFMALNPGSFSNDSPVDERQSMRVAMYYNNRDVRLQEMPLPETGPGELLVKVMASGICGSDVLEWYRIKKAPLVLGHEIAGEIVSIGEGLTNYAVGERVFVSHHIPCNTCHYCLNGYHTACHTLHTTNFFPGGFSEYLRVPHLNVDRGVFRLPAEMSYDEATFIEPLACVVRGQRTANLKAYLGPAAPAAGQGAGRRPDHRHRHQPVSP